MSTILRIRSPQGEAVEGDAPAGGAAAADSAKQYIERVVKLIPTEVVGVYLVGKAGIQARFADKTDHSQDLFSETTYWVGWTAFCFLAVIVGRAWATSDQNTPAEKPAVAIAAISFLIWVYSLGDVFKVIEIRNHTIWDSLLAMLLVFAWTLIVPLFYKER
ncbi:hypothetical protein AAE026_07995 [Bradyrhizobium sp. DN5]|uniref:hypothetical protein n=1 Tax=Bradyrhizobium sp. DN5 TaxID=3056950 RepID=UPI0035245255